MRLRTSVMILTEQIDECTKMNPRFIRYFPKSERSYNSSTGERKTEESNASACSQAMAAQLPATGQARPTTRVVCRQINR